MSNEKMLSELSELIGDILDLDDLILTETTVADDVDGWDSLAHVRIVVAAEQKFGVRFSTSEITSLASVGELASLIERHQSTSD
jgi:acyl carrier protein